jgi:hypothetical protein
MLVFVFMALGDHLLELTDSYTAFALYLPQVETTERQCTWLAPTCRIRSLILFLVDEHNHN